MVTRSCKNLDLNRHDSILWFTQIKHTRLELFVSEILRTSQGTSLVSQSYCVHPQFSKPALSESREASFERTFSKATDARPCRVVQRYRMTYTLQTADDYLHRLDRKTNTLRNANHVYIKLSQQKSITKTQHLRKRDYQHKTTKNKWKSNCLKYSKTRYEIKSKKKR